MTRAWRNTFKTWAGLALSCAVLVFSGCAPSVVCSVETVILPDYTVRRTTRMDASPNPRFPGQRPRLGEYFQLPPAELYDTYAVQPEKAYFSGTFDNYGKIPNDLVRPTPGSTYLAGNICSFSAMDLVLFVWADFDETLTDIVTGREDGEAALSELLRLAIPEIMSVLNAKYGAKYDLSRFEAWLYNDFSAKLRRIYSGLWDIHRAERSGVVAMGEELEMYMFLTAEAKREGLELAPPNEPNLMQENTRRIREYVIALAQKLCPPKQTGEAPISREQFSGAVAEELLSSVQKAITARHGSINAYIGKINQLLPRAFGAYLTGDVMPMYMLPEVTYHYRLKVPGVVLQSNGVRDLNGDLVWSFADHDLAFTGQSMWARTLFVREPVVAALGMKGFPASLGDVDKLFGLCLDGGGAPREALLTALQQSAAVRGLAPLSALADNVSSPDAQAARGVLELVEQYRKRQNPAQSNNPAPTPQPTDMAPAHPPAPQSPPASAAQPTTGVMPAQPSAGGGFERVDNPLAPMQPLEPLQPLQPMVQPDPAARTNNQSQSASAASPNVGSRGMMEPPPLPSLR